MTEKIQVWAFDGGIGIQADTMPSFNLTEDEVEALREYFRDERDRELGRWRDPEYPHIFVRPNSGGNPEWVGVVKDNAEGLAYGQFRRGDYPSLDPMSIVAHRYFAANPEKKPWHEAKPGEVWVIVGPTFEEVACTVVRSGGELYFEDPVHDTFILIKGEITDGHRIWPESKES